MKLPGGLQSHETSQNNVQYKIKINSSDNFFKTLLLTLHV